MKKRRIPQIGDIEVRTKYVHDDFFFRKDGYEYIAERGDWVVITTKYLPFPAGWTTIDMRSATEEEIETAKGPVKWWHFFRRYDRWKASKSLPVARLV